MGCEERACRRSYHYFCALCDDATIETDEVNGVYRYLTKYFLTNYCQGLGGGVRKKDLKVVWGFFKAFFDKEVCFPFKVVFNHLFTSNRENVFL